MRIELKICKKTFNYRKWIDGVMCKVTQSIMWFIKEYFKFYLKVVKYLQGLNFKLNPYDRCSSNKVVNK